MPSRFVGAFCILLLALAPGCAREDASDDVSRQVAATGVEAFFRYGMQELGPARADFRRQLGAPDSVTTRPMPNPHDAAVVDTVFTLHYPDLEAEVYRASFDGRELLAALRISHERYLRPESPIRTGASVDELHVLLGPPDATEDGDLVYGCPACTLGGNDAVRLMIDQGVLRTIAVHYWLD